MRGREAYMRVCPDDHPDAQAAATRYRTLARGRLPPWSNFRRAPGACTSFASTWPRSAGPSPGDARYGGALVLAGRRRFPG